MSERGRDYIALSRISRGAEDELLVPAGGTCEALDDTTLDWLISGGSVRHVDAPAAMAPTPESEHAHAPEAIAHEEPAPAPESAAEPEPETPHEEQEDK